MLVDRELLKQMNVRVQHVPKRVLDEFASRPTRKIAGWDESVWEASHVDPFLKRAKKSDLRRAVIHALRGAGFSGRCHGKTLFYVTEKVGSVEHHFVFDFGGHSQMRLHLSIGSEAQNKIENITLPFCLGYVVDDYNEITVERLADVGRVAVHEFETLLGLAQRAIELA